MSVMLSLLSWFLLAMAAGGGLHANSATAEVMIASDTAVVSAYWHTMLPNTPMPLAILELLTPPAGIVNYIGGRESNNVKTIGKAKEDKYIGASFHKARKMGPSTTNNDVQKSNNKWGPSVWGSATIDNVQKSNNNWGPSVWGSATTDDVQKSNNKWGPFVWGSATIDNVQKSNNNWGPSVWGLATTDDVQKSNNNWGPSVWGSATTNNVQKSNNNWGPSVWGPSTKGEHKRGDQKDVPLLEMGESHIGRDNHKHGTMSDMVFLEEALKPGSTITCYIQPSSTSGAPLLRRDVADSIPMSMRNFTDIMTFFAPTSSYMAGDIWSTLEFCENPQPIKGETKTCATSVESMVEFTASVLGVSTYNLQAFSSPDVPVEGVMTGRGYKVVSATRVTETGDTVTCHGLRFPFATFMCHAVNPTRVYSVTLEGEDVGLDGARQMMEVLSVCHLDTSEFDPAKMPVHIKPGDAPICHFISRDSILYAPAATASAHVSA